MVWVLTGSLALPRLGGTATSMNTVCMMTALLRTIPGPAPLALVVALAACVPSWGQVGTQTGSYFARPGNLEADLAQAPPPGDQTSSVVPASWDESSWLLEKKTDSSQPELRPGFMGRLMDLARGRVMIEGGYAYVTDSSTGTTITEHVVPDLLMRIGVTERIEVRIGWPGASFVEQDGPLGSSSTTTTLDPNVGFMMDLWSQRGWLPQTAVLGSIPITMGGNSFAMNSLQPVSAFLYQWTLTDRLSVGGDSGLAFYRDDGDHYLQWQQSVDADYLLTDRVGVFSEWQVLADDGSESDATRHLLSIGASWLCTDRLQITWRAGVGLNDPAPDFLTDVRFGFLF